tara:strand:+ start:10666 stop:11463 length:798 start_codon:yes stop_codon:yes gene_type:complete
MNPIAISLFSIAVTILVSSDIQNVQSILSKASVSENGAVVITDRSDGFVRRNPNHDELAILENIADSWRGIFDTHLSEVAPTPKEQLVILRVCEALSSEEYLEVLEAAIQFVKQGDLAPEVVFRAVIGQGEKDGFVAFNYKSSRVQQLLDDVLEVAVGTDYELLFLKAKRGDLVRNVVLARQNSGRPLPESIGQDGSVVGAGKESDQLPAVRVDQGEALSPGVTVGNEGDEGGTTGLIVFFGGALLIVLFIVVAARYSGKFKSKY